MALKQDKKLWVYYGINTMSLEMNKKTSIKWQSIYKNGAINEKIKSQTQL